MSKNRNLADLLDSTGDVKSDALDNVSGLPDAIDVNGSAPADSLNIDSSGNVGIGVTPESSTHTSYKNLDIANGGAIAAHTAGNGLKIMGNAYRSQSGYAYKNTDKASNYFNDDGTHGFQVASSGTADSAISWTTALTITNDGRGLSQFTAKAWIKLHQGNNTIYDSHNVSSISHPESGQTLVNFTNSMGDTDYCAVASSGYFYSGNTGVMDFYSGSLRVVNSSSSSYTDTGSVNVVVFGD